MTEDEMGRRIVVSDIYDLIAAVVALERSAEEAREMRCVLESLDYNIEKLGENQKEQESYDVNGC